MSEVDGIENQEDYMRSSVARFRCEECGYKWQVKEMDVETDENDGTVYYDANEDLEPSTCPLCGCSDILTL